MLACYHMLTFCALCCLTKALTLAFHSFLSAVDWLITLVRHCGWGIEEHVVTVKSKRSTAVDVESGRVLQEEQTEKQLKNG